jgi:hypothetical protein
MSEERIKSMEQRMDSIEGKIDRIINLLQDDEFGRPGMNTRLNMLEKKQGYADDQINKMKWTAGIIAAIISLVAAAVTIAI